MSLTHLSRSRGKLDVAMDRLYREIASRFTDLLEAVDHRSPTGRELRRSLILRVARLDPVIDQAIGEPPKLGHRGAILHAAVAGPFTALSGWRIAEGHLGGLSPDSARCRASTLVGLLPSPWTSADAAAPWTDPFSDFADDRRDDLAAVRALSGLPADGVDLGLTAAENGLAPLRDPASSRDSVREPGFVVTDVLPALVNAIRVFPSIGTVMLFCIVTEWSSGLGAVTFTAATVLLLSPHAKRSGMAAIGFGVGTLLAACLAAVAAFELLPNREGFPSLALVMAAGRTPLAALSTVSKLAPFLVAATTNFLPLLGSTNVISFDTVTFYDAALAIVAGCPTWAAALMVIPQVPASVRAARLVDLKLSDLRRRARGRWSPSPADWQDLVYARLVVMPEHIAVAFEFQLVAALTLGLQVLRLLDASGREPGGTHVADRLRALARSDLCGMAQDLDRVDEALARFPTRLREADGTALRTRVAIQVVRDVVRQHPGAFGGYER